MQLNEIRFEGAMPVEGYGSGFFRVAGQVIEGAIVVKTQAARSWGGYEETDVLTTLVGEIDVLFIGTGAETGHVPAEFRKTLEDAGLGVEAMNSPAACRTYNVLLSEGRRVAVALLPV